MFPDLPLLVIIFFWFEWVVRLAAFFIVPPNRKPASATSWLMLIMLFPTLGLLAFILIGSPKLSKKRQGMQKTMDDIINTAIQEALASPKLRQHVHLKTPERLQPFASLSYNLGGLPAFSDNSLELLDEYEEILRRIANDIDQAESFVHIEFFILALDSVTESIFLAMERAVQRGVIVRVLFDGVIPRRYPRFKEMRRRLTSIGVQWHPMLPLRLPGRGFNRPDLRNHRKIIVIDARIGYTGSLNLIQRNYHRKDKIVYDELMARVEGPIVTQLHGVFITDWYCETGEVLTRSDHPEINLDFKEKGDIMAISLPSGPGYDTDNNLKLFTELIHAAKHSIVIVNPYFVPDESLMIALSSAAQRGVEVTMINSVVIDQWMVGHAQRSYYEEILRSGIKVFLYEAPTLLHSKYITIDDDLAVIGSSNLDMRSFQLDLEISLLLYSKAVVKDFNTLTKKYLTKSHRLGLNTWSKRSKRLKLLENLARLTATLQ